MIVLMKNLIISKTLGFLKMIYGLKKVCLTKKNLAKVLKYITMAVNH